MSRFSIAFDFTDQLFFVALSCRNSTAVQVVLLAASLVVVLLVGSQALALLVDSQVLALRTVQASKRLTNHVSLASVHKNLLMVYKLYIM